MADRGSLPPVRVAVILALSSAACGKAERHGGPAGCPDVLDACGTLADGVKASFGVRFTAPAKTGTLLFPTVQTCVNGKNSWIDAPLAGGGEPENPAPVVVVTNTPAAAKKKAAGTH